MPTLTWAASFEFIKWVFATGLASLKTAFHDSPKWVSISIIAFVALIYFGFMKAPRVDPDAATKAQIADLANKIDSLGILIARKTDELKAVKASEITTGTVVKHKKR